MNCKTVQFQWTPGGGERKRIGKNVFGGGGLEDLFFGGVLCMEMAGSI